METLGVPCPTCDKVGYIAPDEVPTLFSAKNTEQLKQDLKHAQKLVEKYQNRDATFYGITRNISLIAVVVFSAITAVITIVDSVWSHYGWVRYDSDVRVCNEMSGIARCKCMVDRVDKDSKDEVSQSREAIQCFYTLTVQQRQQ